MDLIRCIISLTSVKGGPSEGLSSHQRSVIEGSTLHLSEVLGAGGTLLHTEHRFHSLKVHLKLNCDNFLPHPDSHLSHNPVINLILTLKNEKITL